MHGSVMVSKERRSRPLMGGGQIIMLVWSSKTKAGPVDCLFPQKYQLDCILKKRQLETKVILATTDLAGSVIALAWWSWSYSSLMVPRRRTVFAAFSAGRPLILAAYMLKMGWLALFPSPQKNMTGYVEEVEAVLRIQHYIIYTNTNVKISIKATSFCWVATTWVPQTDKANQ